MRCLPRSRWRRSLGGLGLLTFVACAGQDPRAPEDAATGPVKSAETVAVAPPSAPLASASAPVPEDPSADAGAVEKPPEPALPQGEPELLRFQKALLDLSKGRRKEHVRILWLGDSHGQADFWTGAVRDVLQKRFGKAGPGFVHLGWKAYRHDGVKLAIDGKWSISPKAPATSARTGDGIFGLGGVITKGPAGSGKARATVTDQGLTGRLSWDICYRLQSSADALQIGLGQSPTTTVTATPTEPAGEVRHLVLVSEGRDTLHVTPTRGTPTLCGVVIESDPNAQPGVVLDTLGINGARLGTPLAWDEASFGRELVRRNPSLLVVEYGTNEAGDYHVDPAKYTEKLVRLVERVRKFAPEVDCVALAPTDRADTRERTPLVRDAIRQGAQKVGCSFWDTYAVMGGEGSIKAWKAEAEPRASSDGVHLTPKGYRQLGEALAAHLLKGLPE